MSQNAADSLAQELQKQFAGKGSQSHCKCMTAKSTTAGDTQEHCKACKTTAPGRHWNIAVLLPQELHSRNIGIINMRRFSADTQQNCN